MNTLTLVDIQEKSISTTLKHLLKKSKKSGNSLARELGFPPPTINRLVIGDVKDPRLSTLIAIADYYKISIEQLIGRINLPDNPTNQKHDGETTTSKLAILIPVLSTMDAVEYKKHLLNPLDYFRWQENESSKNHNIFSVKIKSDLYQPVFPINTLVIVNPELKPESNDYVLVVFSGDSTGTIKKYVSEGRYKYLYSLNQELKTIPFEPNDCVILGVIIEAFIAFK